MKRESLGRRVSDLRRTYGGAVHPDPVTKLIRNKVFDRFMVCQRDLGVSSRLVQTRSLRDPAEAPALESSAAIASCAKEKDFHNCTSGLTIVRVLPTEIYFIFS